MHPPELRPETDADREFLERLYASTREEELAPVPWTPEEKRAFLAWQFEAQRRHYRQYYPEASFDVIERGGCAVGRLYVDRREEELRIVDIALLPEARGRGIGTRLVTELLEEAAEGGRVVTIHVELANPALRLYQRLGFRPVEERGVYLLMEWSARDQLKIAS